MAWNEEDSICTTLESLLRQSVFGRLAARGQQCEIVVVANGCTDRTAAVAQEFLQRATRQHAWPGAIAAKVIALAEGGKCNAWNHFVHEFSSLEASFLAFMDADVLFHHQDTIYNLMTALEREPYRGASSGRQCKDILFKPRKTLRDRISLATSTMSGAAPGQLCGQLYCLRAEVARNLYLPKKLPAVEDGFIKAAVCTTFFTRASEPWRVAFVPDAAHIFEAYLSARDILNNQKRQMIGQTAVHVLVEFIKTLSLTERRHLAITLRQLDERDPDWLQKKIAAHVQAARHFWRLFPQILSFRFRRLASLPGAKKITHLPVACVGLAVTLVACARAHRAIRAGSMQYWPKATRQLVPLSQTGKVA